MYLTIGIAVFLVGGVWMLIPVILATAEEWVQESDDMGP